MNYGRFIKLFCLMVALGVGFLSFSGYAQEEVPDPAYLKAIESREQQPEIEKPLEKNKAPLIVQDKKSQRDVERVCLSGHFCMNADFSDAPDAKKFVQKCEQFNREYPNPPSRELSKEAHACFSFLLGFGQALSLQSYANYAAGSKSQLFCVGGAAEDMPEKYLRFMGDNPEMLSKNFSYGVFRFFEETFQCVDNE